MSETPSARASMTIDRPLPLVRAQFFDVDHAIRDRIHHGVNLRRLPPASPGEVRVEQEFKMLAYRHVDVFVVEEGVDGAWVRRFVEGPNTGTRFVATFAAKGDVATEVAIGAHVGPTGYFSGLGKLSSLGVEKALQKLLAEHQRALDGYEPGRARSAVATAIGALRERVLGAPASASGKSRALMTNFLEAACVIALADGCADEPERDAMKAVARELCFMELDDELIERMVQNVQKAVAADGIAQRCEKIGARLRALEVAELGLGVAALIAQVSRGIDPPELDALRSVAFAAGLDEDALASIIKRLDEQLAGSATSP